MNYLRVGDMAKEANFVFLAIFSGGRPFFSAVFHGLVPPDMFPGGRPCSLGWQEAQPCTERLLMNCAPCITRLFSGHLACPVPEKGVSNTEYPSCTGNACFLHRMSQKMRRVPQEPVFCTARIFRTVGGPLRYRILRMPEKRRALPVPNLSNCQKGEGHGPEHDPECRREQENNSLRPQNPPANSTTTQRPTTATHHSYTLGQQKTPPIQNTTSIHSHPPRLSEKSASQSAIGLLGTFWQG